MIKSYSYQKSRNNRPQRPSNLVLKLPVLLPEDIDKNLEDEIYSLLMATEFDKIPVLVYVKAGDIGLDTNINRGPSYIKVGYLKKFECNECNDEVTGFFDVSIYNSRNSDAVKKFKHPVIEVEYNDYNNNKLLNIVRFNIIDHMVSASVNSETKKEPVVSITSNREIVMKIQNEKNDVEYINENDASEERLASPIGEIIGNR